MRGRKKHHSTCTIQQINASLNDVNNCISLLSKQLFPETLIDNSTQTILAMIDFFIVKFLLTEGMFQHEKLTAGIGWSTFFSTAMISAHLLIYAFGADRINTLSISDDNRKRIHDSAKNLGVDTSDMLTSQLDFFKQKKIDLQSIIEDKKAWYTFLLFNHSKQCVSKDIASYIEEFVLPAVNNR